MGYKITFLKSLPPPPDKLRGFEKKIAKGLKC